ncbi:MAG TPA: hypothetical protein VGM34_01495, partial [Chlamydiales bacterium]
MAIADTKSLFERNQALAADFIRESFKFSHGQAKQNDIVQICTDYLFSTVFPSIRSFVLYCQHNDVIELPANQALVVHGVSLIQSNRTEADIPAINRIQATSRFFSTLISPLGKVFSLVVPPSNKGARHTIDTDISFCSVKISLDSTWKVESRPADLRLSDLLRLMVISSIFSVIFTKNVIFWGLKQSEYEALLQAGDVRTMSDSLIPPRRPPGISRIG